MEEEVTITENLDEVYLSEEEVVNDLQETNEIIEPDDDPTVPTQDDGQSATPDATPIEIGVIAEVLPDDGDTISETETNDLTEAEIAVEAEEVQPVINNTATLPTIGHVSEGERVMVALINGEATVLGTVGSGDAQVTRISNLETDYAEIDTLVAQKASITDLTAATGRITNLETDNTSIKGRLTAAEGNITTLTTEKATVTDLTAATGRITTLETENTSVKGRLTAAEGNITTLTSSKANVSDLTATNANVTALQTGKADIDLANVTAAWITNGVIANGAITNAMINDVSANKLTAGTIDASNITVTNLNASNITTGTINGQRIGTGSLSLDKLSESVYTQSEVDDIAEDLQDQILAQIETWTGNAVPTLNNYPASNWTTTDLKHNHVGDVYYVINPALTQDGYCYRFAEGSNSSYSWVLIKDSDVTKALADLLTAQGDISDIQTFDSTVTSYMTNNDSEITSIKSRATNLETRMTTAEGSISNKVDSSTFNTLSQTVDTNTANITTLTTITTNNGLTTSTNISNTVNSISQTATSNSTKISNLTTTLGTNADGTTKSTDIVHRTSSLEQDLSGFKTTVSQTYTTQTTTSDLADRVTANTNALEDKADAADTYSKDQVDETITTVTQSYRSEIQETASQINQSIAETYADKTTVSDLSTLITETARSWNLTITDIQTAVGEAVESLGITNENLQQLVTYVHVENEGTSPCLSLGSSESNVTAALLNNRLEFRVKGSTTPVAYIEVDENTHVGKLYITSAVITSEISFGDWKWYGRANGNLALKWIGA